MLFDRQETLSRVLESTTAFVRFRYKAFLKLHFIIRNGVPLHFTIRNTVPYNKPLTNRACSGRTGEYWPSVVAVRTWLRSVRTTTTSGQYSPVRPSRSVSKRLLFYKSGGAERPHKKKLGGGSSSLSTPPPPNPSAVYESYDDHTEPEFHIPLVSRPDHPLPTHLSRLCNNI